MAATPKAELDGARVVASGQLVAEHAVEHRLKKMLVRPPRLVEQRGASHGQQRRAGQSSEGAAQHKWLRQKR